MYCAFSSWPTTSTMLSSCSKYVTWAFDCVQQSFVNLLDKCFRSCLQVSKYYCRSSSSSTVVSVVYVYSHAHKCLYCVYGLIGVCVQIRTQLTFSVLCVVGWPRELMLRLNRRWSSSSLALLHLKSFIHLRYT